jgi:hypothetical protein
MTPTQIKDLFASRPHGAANIIKKDQETFALISHLPGSSIAEKAYNFVNPGSAEKHKYCLTCKIPFKNFISFNQGYRANCSFKCAANSPIVKQNKVLGMIRNHGVANPSQSPEIRAKQIATNMAKYGMASHLQRDSVKATVKNNLIKKYGVDHTFKISDVKTRARKNKKTNYSINLWPIRLELIENTCKVKLTGSTRDHQGDGFEYLWTHNCGTSYRSDVMSGYITRCPLCKIEYRSEGETKLAEFIGEHTNTILNSRDLIPPYEIDIYCPDLKLAFEFNGVYWHSDEYKSKNYHLKKMLRCQKQGIKLIQIFEDDWSLHQDIIKSRILASLGKAKRIYARHCDIIDVSSVETKKFLEQTHLQGSIGSRVRIGLRYNGEIVALMTFGKPRFNTNFDWELLRYSTALNTTVIGGPSKILSHFLKSNHGSILSYADRCWSDGNLYKQLGFTEINSSPPSHFYVKGTTKFSRFQTQKHKLQNFLGDKYQSALTAPENMKINGFHCIYDCGSLVFQYNKEKE